MVAPRVARTIAALGVLLLAFTLATSCEWVLPAPPEPEISCVDVETSYCQRIADEVLASPPPGHGVAESVVLRCITDPPCAADRLDSEGRAVITMEDGFQWDQGFGPGMGT